MQDDAVIVSAVRTAIGEAGKSLATLPAWDLAEIACREAILRADIDPAVLDDVVLGETIGGGGNVGRYVGLKVGVPREVPGYTVIRACATGLEAVTQAATGVWAGTGEAFVAGGTESMSQQPWLQRKPSEAFARRPPEYFIPLTHPLEMGPFSVGINTGENVAEKYGVTREDQDGWSLESHRRAVAAIDAGRFEDEIVAVAVPQRRGDAVEFLVDERPRRDTSLEQLAKLPAVYKEGGTVTAGNASGRNDAAAALIVTSARKAETLGLRPRAVIRGWASVGVDPMYTGTGPIEAVPKALKRAGISLDDVDLVELNEAFAAMTVACVRELGLDPERTNVNGGAVALGHPVGATGARLLVTLLHELERRGGRYGVATMCAGGGLGSAAVIERIEG
ncbi:MAG: acetyl-CoA C-acyltransferase [Actinomycetota bacterium]